ncbi:MAG: HD domain-containing protein [Candidatus Omnitrophica bacterium]|nr:HD domain-containing protein [Candidatus Omnitrophota bacterium]
MKSHFEFSLEERNLLKAVYSFAKTHKVRPYIVGGILRDILLGREKENPDIDFCIKKGAINFGRQLAREIKAGFVVLDKEHGACRLVRKAKDKIYTLDFTDFRGKDLEDDLRHRDFTINALALEWPRGTLIDPCSGAADLARKIIRVPDKGAFIEDPLRILRAFSFSSLLGFKIQKETLHLARQAKKLLSKVSCERIRDELFKLLDSRNSYEYFQALDKLGILKIILPEIELMRGVAQGPYHNLGVWEHSLEALRQFEAVVEEFKKNSFIHAHLEEEISCLRPRRSLIKLAMLLHDVGKPGTMRREGKKLTFHGHEHLSWDIGVEIARRLKLSNDELDALRKMIVNHLRPGYLADQGILTPRAKFRYFRDTGIEAPSVLLISLADQRATRGRLTTKESRARHEKTVSVLLREYFKQRGQKKVTRLLNGDDLIKIFKLQPSPLIGRILSEIEELQAIGRIKNKDGALKISAGLIKKTKAKNEKKE